MSSSCSDGPAYSGKPTELQFITTQSGRVLLLYRLSKYYFERTLKQSGHSKWRCCKKQCCAYVLTSGHQVVISDDTHNHGVTSNRAQSCPVPLTIQSSPSISMLMPPSKTKTVISENQHSVPSNIIIINCIK